MPGVTLRWPKIPFRGCRNTPTEIGDKLRPGGPLGLHADFTLTSTWETKKRPGTVATAKGIRVWTVEGWELSYRRI